MTECLVKFYPTDKNNPDGWKSGETVIDDKDGKRMIILMDPDEVEVRWVRHERGTQFKKD